MKCSQLGGACEKIFTANTFEEIAHLSKLHGMEMMKKGDIPHIQAMQKLQDLMHNPEDWQKWMDEKKSDFNELNT